jgi:hypothetical protein
MEALAIAEGDVGHLVASARRVDNAATSENQVRHVHAAAVAGKFQALVNDKDPT